MININFSDWLEKQKQRDRDREKREREKFSTVPHNLNTFTSYNVNRYRINNKIIFVNNKVYRLKERTFFNLKLDQNSESKLNFIHKIPIDDKGYKIPWVTYKG